MLKTLIKSIFAGIMISIGGIAYLSIDNKIIGSLFFGIGLFTILIFNFYLFTGKVGTLIKLHKIKHIINLVIIWIGNLISTYLMSLIIKQTRILNNIKIDEMINIKTNDSFLSIFILSIFCGILMHIAVSIFNSKQHHDGIVKVIGVFLPVSVFILCGFEHCVANMFYFNLAGDLNIEYILIMTLGNTVGSLLLSFYDYKINKYI